MGYRLFITLRVIIRALFPGSGNSLPGVVSLVPADLDLAVGRDGKLSLRFYGCAAPAAPFVLFRLKRAGFSDCRASVTADCLVVEAQR